MYMQYVNYPPPPKKKKKDLVCFSRDKFSRQQAFYVGT